MSHGVYSVSTDGLVLLNPEAVKLEPHLKYLNSNQVLYIIWAYDYMQSPVRKKPLEDRKRIARARFFPKEAIDFDLQEIMKNGIDSFKSLIYDEQYETCEIYKNKIRQMQHNLVDAESIQDIKNITNTIDLLRKKVEELENSIDENDQIIYVKGDRKLSLLEIWQRNRKLSRKLTGAS